MPAKSVPNEDLAFVMMCLKHSDFQKSTINWDILAAHTGLKRNSVQKRFSTLEKATDTASSSASSAPPATTISTNTDKGSSRGIKRKAADDGGAAADGQDGNTQGSPRKKQAKAKGKAAATKKVKEESVSGEEENGSVSGDQPDNYSAY